MFSFANSTFPDVRCSSSSRIGSIALHGPHHGAQKSTTTGTSAASTSRSNVESLTSNTGGIVAGASSGTCSTSAERDGPDLRVAGDQKRRLSAARRSAGTFQTASATIERLIFDPLDRAAHLRPAVLAVDEVDRHF